MRFSMVRLVGLVLMGAVLSAGCAPAVTISPTSTAPPPTVAKPVASPAASASPSVAATAPSPVAAQSPTQATAAKPSPAAPSPSASAAASPSAQQQTSFPLTLSDDRGKSITLGAPPQRIVTLQPSSTESACAVDACARVVATDDFSDFPDEVKQRPKLGGLNMSAEAIIGQRPDLVLTDSGTRADLVQQIEQAGLIVLVTDAKTFDDVYRDIGLIARALGSAEAGTRVVDGMRARAQAVTSKTNAVSRRPRVFHELDASDPNRPFAVGPGTFIDQIITLAGGSNALAASPVAYPQVSTEQVVAADPEIITLGDEDFGTSPDDVAARPGWAGITAVKNRAIVAVDTNQVSRPGPRLVAALEQFAHIIHPELFP